MKTRHLAFLLPLVGLALWLTLAAAAAQNSTLSVTPSPDGGPSTAPSTPLPLRSGSAQDAVVRREDEGESSPHIPYDPFARHDTLPPYPYNTLPLAGDRPGATLVKPAGVDLDVTYISRAPMYNAYQVQYTEDLKPYLQPGTEDDQRWPAPGEVVTFTAHFANKGTAASGGFAFKWFVDETEVASGLHGSLGPGEAGMETYRWAWAHGLDGERLLGSHVIRFTVDPANTIAETYESNNSLADRTDALALTLAVSPELYAALETPVDPQYPFSAEDWLQKQIAAMNAAFARSVYPPTPDGTVERVRLNRIVVAASPPPADPTGDGGFFMSADDRQGNPYYDPATDVSGALIHELSHQLGVIDLYNLGFELGTPEVVDQRGWPVQMETGLPPTGLMLNPGIRPPIYEEHSVHGLNANKGYRRGYYGEYLFDVPQQTSLRILDNRGQPAPGVTVRLFQSGPGRPLAPTTIDNTAEITGTTDADGLVLLTNRPVGPEITTRTGHILRDNPFGVIDIIGERDEFILELTRGAHQEYGWLEITRFNLAAWEDRCQNARSGAGILNGAVAESKEPAERSYSMAASFDCAPQTTRGAAQDAFEATTMDIPSHILFAAAPASPSDLIGLVEQGQVKLLWPTSVPPFAAGYNLYRTASRPTFGYERAASGISGTSQIVPYDDGSRAIAYAVTAVDATGRESGFSPFFNAFRLVNPAAVALDERGQRIVLDPQNGYALFLQLPDGRFFDTLGSIHYHLEFSRFLARDALGRLILSHPGDWYDGRHSIRVADAEANPLFEFGARGSDPGQFENPAGVAVWGQPCTVEGPHEVDAHTLLLLHFDGTYDGAQGEQGAPNGTTFTDGRYAQGVLADGGDTLTYPSAGNIGRTQGAIEFWLRSTWDGGDGQNYTFFEIGDDWFNRLRIMKDGANNLRFMVWDNATEYGVAYNVAYWRAGEWHHVAVTWQGATLTLAVDGQEQGRSDAARPPDRLTASLSIGSTAWNDQQANAVMDEFRISDIPRVGNSDTCSYRILVADSSNGRIQAFDAMGNFVSAYGSPGSGPGQFNDPQGVTVDAAGRVIVADRGNNRLQLLAFDGAGFSFVRSITGGFAGPTGVAAYGDGRIIVADTGHNLVKVLVPHGNDYVVADISAPNDGHTGPFNAPAGVAADPAGHIVVADTGNRRVATIRNALPVVTPTPTPTGPPLVPSPTPTPTRLPSTLTPTPTVTHGGCTERVSNGGFESDSAWDFPVTANRAGYTAAQAHSGQRSARFGLTPGVDLTGLPRPVRSEANLLGEIAPENASFSSAYQTISIPANADSAVLTFWYKPGTEATEGDYQRVMLLDPNGYTYIATLLRVLEHSGIWQQAHFDLTPYRGRSVTLYFEVYNDNISAGPRTWMFLDDVSVLVCAGPTPTPTPTALPVTIRVNTTDDELNSDGDCSLREAIQAANLNAAVDACPAGHGDDTIELPAGYYLLQLPGAGEDANVTGDLDIRSNLTLAGAGARTTTIGGAGLDRVLHVHFGAVVAIHDTAVTGGRTLDGADSITGGGSADPGAGIFNEGTLTLTGCVVGGNRTGRGGSNTEDYFNGGPGGDGGAGAGIFNSGALILDRCVVGDNHGGNGGAGISSGRAGSGGGIYNKGALTVQDSLIAFNDTGTGGRWVSPPGSGGGSGGDGGGIYNSGVLTVTHSTINGNRCGDGEDAGGSHGFAGGGGAGAGIFNEGRLYLSNSTISGNHGGNGGAALWGGEGGDGGGVYNKGVALLEHSTISTNTTGASGVAESPGGDGGGIINLGTATIKGLLLAGNSTAHLGPDCHNTLDSLGYNLIQDADNCTLRGDLSGNIIGQNPHLAPLADNGGPLIGSVQQVSLTHALTAGSPAVDAGICTQIDGATLTTDQRGVRRPQSQACDIGAFERGASAHYLPLVPGIP
ncbi:MAG: CSLREA domain-containing protein [Chloroflexi bacterium]|nr:CSLREA domain-containing protein [Chloroflexota bacterium]